MNSAQVSEKKDVLDNKTLFTLMGIIAILFLIDMSLTYVGLSRWGIDQEGNVLLLLIFQRAGLFWGMILNLCIGFAFMIAMATGFWLGRNSKYSRPTLYVMFSMFVISRVYIITFWIAALIGVI